VDSSKGLNLCTPVSLEISCLGTLPSRLPIMRVVEGRYSPVVAAMRFRSFVLSRIFSIIGWSRSR